MATAMHSSRPAQTPTRILWPYPRTHVRFGYGPFPSLLSVTHSGQDHQYLSPYPFTSLDHTYYFPHLTFDHHPCLPVCPIRHCTIHSDTHISEYNCHLCDADDTTTHDPVQLNQHLIGTHHFPHGSFHVVSIYNFRFIVPQSHRCPFCSDSKLPGCLSPHASKERSLHYHNSHNKHITTNPILLNDMKAGKWLYWYTKKGTNTCGVREYPVLGIYIRLTTTVPANVSPAFRVPNLRERALTPFLLEGPSSTVDPDDIEGSDEEDLCDLHDLADVPHDAGDQDIEPTFCMSFAYPSCISLIGARSRTSRPPLAGWHFYPDHTRTP